MFVCGVRIVQLICRDIFAGVNCLLAREVKRSDAASLSNSGLPTAIRDRNMKPLRLDEPAWRHNCSYAKMATNAGDAIGASGAQTTGMQ